uniref:Uncharacterized protein n=1 Tax=Caenorhabditis japonica TaxID=281687 RepID=A0A8R1EQH4_CAEJA
MAQVENLPKKLDTVTFVHIFKIRPIDIKHMMPVQFVTAYEHGLINWHIQIAENGGFPSFIRNILEDQLAHREPNYQITLHPAGSRERHPPVHKVHFKMRTVDSEDRDIFAPLTYTHPSGQAVRDILHSGYSTPEQHEIKHHIAAVLGKNIFEHLKFEITTTIDFEIEQFLSMQNLNRLVGKAMPVQLGFRYNLLTN